MEDNSTPEGGAEDFSWRHFAKCGEMSKDNVFFQDIWYADENALKASIAASICFQCPVRQECLKEACDTREPYGIWGGQPASIRNQRGRVHNFLRLINLPDPYETEDNSSPFHISNLGDSSDERE